MPLGIKLFITSSSRKKIAFPKLPFLIFDSRFFDFVLKTKRPSSIDNSEALKYVFIKRRLRITTVFKRHQGFLNEFMVV